MEKKKLYTLFLAVLMLGSILGYTALNNAPKTQPPQGAPPDVGSDQQTTAIEFEANGVQATVEQLFPTVFVTAQTTESEISKINSKILVVTGVKNVNNSFYRTEQTGGLVYVAELGIADTASRQQILDELSAMDFLSNPNVFSIGLASIPKTVSFKNAQLNLTQDYNFANPVSQVYLNLDTLKGDKISVTMQAAFSGSVIQSVLAAEETNISASPKIVSLKEELEILSTKPVFLLEAKTSATEREKLGQIKQKTEQINGVSQAQFEAKGLPADPFVVSFKSGGLLFEADLNAFFSSFEGIDNFDIDTNNNFQTSFFFQKDQNVQAVLPNLRQELDSLNFLVNDIFVPDVLVQGRIDSNSNDAIGLTGQLKQLLEQNGLKEISFEQQVQVKADALTDQDANVSYPIEKGFFDAKSSVGKQAGQKVLLDIFLIVSRGNIISLSATESKGQNQP